jgi:hypothetical protein
VDDTIDARDRWPERAAGQVGLDQLDRLTVQPAQVARGSYGATNGKSRLEESVHDVAPNQAGTAGHQDFGLFGHDRL